LTWGYKQVAALEALGETGKARALSRQYEKLDGKPFSGGFQNFFLLRAQVGDWPEVDRLIPAAPETWGNFAATLTRIALAQKNKERIDKCMAFVRERFAKDRPAIAYLEAVRGNLPAAEKEVLALPEAERKAGWKMAAWGCHDAGDAAGYARAVEQWNACEALIPVVEQLLAWGDLERARKTLDARQKEIDLLSTDKLKLFWIARFCARVKDLEGFQKFVAVAKAKVEARDDSTWPNQAVKLAGEWFKAGVDEEAVKLLAETSDTVMANEAWRIAAQVHLEKNDLAGALTIGQAHMERAIGGRRPVACDLLAEACAAKGDAETVDKLLGPRKSAEEYALLGRAWAVSANVEQLQKQYGQLTDNKEAQAWFCLGVLKGLNVKREIPAALRPVPTMPQ
jgi:hypothetical protein